MQFSSRFESLFSFLIVAAILALASCGKFDRLTDEEKVTTVRLGWNGQAARRAGEITPDATQNGGVMIWGISKDQKVAVFLTDESQEAVQSLRNGEWTFFAVGWNGSSGYYTGTTSCAVANRTLNGNETTVFLALSGATCSLPFFSAYGNLHSLRLVSCANSVNINSKTGDQACGSVEIGGIFSFKVQINAYGPTPPSQIPFSFGPSPVSNCVNVSGSTAITSIRLPNGFPNFSPNAITINTYNGAGCSGTLKKILFPQGLLSPAVLADDYNVVVNAVHRPVGTSIYTSTEALFIRD